DGSLRLVDGRNPHEGRIEVYYKGIWGTVCGRGFSQKEADVVCRQLGYEKADFCYSVNKTSLGYNPIALQRIHCNGNESQLLECADIKWD
ncbi:uncharacterized protein TRIADDRAFT_16992, partial [Trichoplax adhaerens]